MTTTPTEPTTAERDGLVAAVVRLRRQLDDALEAVPAAQGEAAAAWTEAAAQKARAKDFRLQLEAEQETTTELRAQVADLEAQVAELQAAPTTTEPAPGTMLQANGAANLLVAAAGPVESDSQARTITGRLVPFGQVGSTNMGRFTFAAGSITLPEDSSDVKLLVEHDQRQAIGYATLLEERADGLWGTFHVPPGDPEGDLALTRAANRVRNAFSVGVDLDEATLERARRSRDARPIAASGALRENSLVAVPAFTGARVTDVAASGHQLVVAAWHDLTPTPHNGRTTMHTCQTCGQELLPGVAHNCPGAPGTTAQAAAPAVTTEQLQAAIAGLLGVPAEQANATTPETPATVPAAGAGAATTTQVVSEPPTYTFDGRGHGFIRDAWQARMEGSREAAERIARFGAELAQGGPVVEHIIRAADQELMTAAVETRTTAPEVVQAEVYRGDQLIAAVDRGRPMFARMRNVRLTDATPFKVPVEGEFDGVGAHTEGTAHVAEGTLTLGGVTVEPGAISGAYRFSRELADSSNPAIDGIAMRAMIRDYRRGSEAMVAAALALQSDGVTAHAIDTLSVDTVAELRAELIAHGLANDMIAADFGFSGAAAFTVYATEEATDGRPQLPPLNPSNAVGTSNLRQLAVNLDGTPLAASTGIPTDETYLVNGEDVLVGESNVLTFRFDQPEGPGIIKVALWAYQVAHVMRNAGVRRLTTAAA